MKVARKKQRKQDKRKEIIDIVKRMENMAENLNEKESLQITRWQNFSEAGGGDGDNKNIRRAQ